MTPDAKILRQKWITGAEIALGAGKGHIGIINYLRSEGIPAADAQKLSYDIFDEAKKRLMKSQRAIIWLAKTLIFIGIITPIATYFLLDGFFIASAAPIVGGIILLTKTINPSRLPEPKP